MTGPPPPDTSGTDEKRTKLRRRGFLLGLLSLVAGGVAALRWGLSRGENHDLAPSNAASTPLPTRPTANATANATLNATPGVFSEKDLPVFFALADVIIPRDGAIPPASEVGLLPALEEWVSADPTRQFTYTALWPELAHAASAPKGSGPRPTSELEEACQGWHNEFRQRGGRASSAAKAFEQLRRDVIRTYYSTDTGHRVLGYSGPAMKMPTASHAG